MCRPPYTNLSLRSAKSPAELENFERLHNCSIWFWARVEEEKVKKISCPPNILVELFVKVVFISIYRISKKNPDICAFSTQLDKGEFLSFLKFGQSL